VTVPWLRAPSARTNVAFCQDAQHLRQAVPVIPRSAVRFRYALTQGARQPRERFSSAPKQPFVGPYAQNEATVRTYDVAPDGRFLMILREDESQAGDPGTVVVVQNFSEELKRRVRPLPSDAPANTRGLH
jgi:hypothetical protein